MLAKSRGCQAMLIDKTTVDAGVFWSHYYCMFQVGNFQVNEATYPTDERAEELEQMGHREWSQDLHRLATCCMAFNPDDRYLC